MTRTRRLWTPEEVALLTERATSSSAQELSNLLNRPPKMIRWKAEQLGLKLKDGRQDNPGRERYLWSDEDLAYLRENAPLENAATLGQALDKTEKQVRQALEHYGIEGRGYSRKHTPEEIERRVAPLRGVEKVDRLVDRPCTRCGEIRPVFQFPSEVIIKSGYCEDCRRLQVLANRYSLTVEKIREMRDAQGNSCKLCLREFDPKKRASSMAVDHDHTCCSGIKSCGECVRGLLCIACNSMLGFIEGFLARGGDPKQIDAYLRR